MILLKAGPLKTVDDAYALLKLAINLEFSTLPPYLYALYSILPGYNSEAARRIKSIAQQEMIHMCLVSNIWNALRGNPVLDPPDYPGTLPGDIGEPGKPPLDVHLYRFSPEAMKQGMNIEEPVDPPPIPHVTALRAAAPQSETIGQFYDRLKAFLGTLPATAWIPGRNQITDNQFFVGRLFEVNGYHDAAKAIDEIKSEGEGAKKDDPLDFQHEIAHYYRFGEIFNNQVLTKADNKYGYAWTGTLHIDWQGAYPAIDDPGTHDFSHEPPEARAAQDRCNAAYTAMVAALQNAMTGTEGALGVAVRAMFDLRMAARDAFTVPLADPAKVAGPAFKYLNGASL